MKTVKLTRPMKNGKGYWLTEMILTAYPGEKCIHVRSSRVYYGEPKDIAYLDSSYDLTRHEANDMYTRMVKHGYTAKVKKTVKKIPELIQEIEDDAFDRANMYPISKEWE